MSDITSWAHPTGPVEFTVQSDDSEAKLTMTVTTDNGNIFYLSTTSSKASELRELARRLLEVADRIDQ